MSEIKNNSYPLLPIKNAVLFPAISTPLAVGRPRSVSAILEAQNRNSMVVIVTQKTVTSADPEPEDLHSIGTLCRIEGVTGSEKDGLHIIVSGVSRFEITSFAKGERFIEVGGRQLEDQFGSDPTKIQLLFKSLKQVSQEVLNLLPGGVKDPLSSLLDRLDDPTHLTHLCATYLNLDVDQKQKLLENTDLVNRLETLLTQMKKEKEVLQVRRDIAEKLSDRLNKTQRDAILREHLRTIRDELGDDESVVQEKIEKKFEDRKLPAEVKKVVDEELKKLESIPPQSSEYHVVKNYLDWLAMVPWDKFSQDSLDLDKAQKILDEDHYGMEKIKKRILQHLAVAKLKNNLRGPILCFVGPPGVGKTSLGQSIAKAIGREFVRISLGGVRDEAEIRGHRRTYIGAMPGRVVQAFKRAQVMNPVFMLDEIDKLSSSYHGDPSSALLEVLDPEQNSTFEDHYLDLPLDLSNVFFIATANMMDTIPAPLLDRMEIIDLSSYTTQEKIGIAQKYLIPKQLKEHGLTSEQVEILEPTLQRLIQNYTREAGVRELQRRIAAVCRWAAEKIVRAPTADVEAIAQKIVRVAPEHLDDILGPARFFPELAERAIVPGVVTGLAWTQVGGDILFIEATAMPGTGKLTLTGSLGEVMKESAQIALSLIRSTLHPLAQPFDFEKTDIHIHIPSGAIPKDGPSAGVTMLSALTSLLTGKAVDPKMAMTGEITLRGAVLPVGGIKEKVLAAHRAGLKKVILPERNRSDLVKIPQDVRDQMEFDFVDTAEVLLRRIFGIEKFQRLGSLATAEGLSTSLNKPPADAAGPTSAIN